MAGLEEGSFSAKDGTKLFWHSNTPKAGPVGTVIISHGFAEHSGRYEGVTGFLVEQGYAVHAFDHRGHGKSEGRKGHVDSYGLYVDDLELFYGRVAAKESSPLFLLGHSNGGLIVLHFLLRNPLRLKGVLLSSPYLKLAFKPPAVKLLAAKVMQHVIPWLPIGNELRMADLSRDEAWQKVSEADPMYGRVVSPRWFMESQCAQEEILGQGERVTQPLMMFCGGDDPIASTPTARAFFETLGSRDKHYKEYPGMRHETLNEIGKEEVWRDIVGWISRHQ